MKLYLVMGSTSAMEDYTEWVVCAMTDEATAKVYAQTAENRAAEIFADIEKLGWYNCDREKMCRTNSFDSKMQMDYTGTKYFLKSTDIVTPIEMKFMGIGIFFNKILRFLRIK